MPYLTELLAIGALLTAPAASPRDDLAARARQLGLPKPAQIAADAKPGARLVAGGEDTVGGARLGGDPDLPPKMAWPKCRGNRLTLLAQLPVNDIAALDPGALPASGDTLAVFADLKPDDNGVLRMEDPGAGLVGKQTCVVVKTLRGTLTRRTTPKGVAKLRSRPVRLIPTLTVRDSYVADKRYGLTDKQLDKWWKLEYEASGGTLGGPTDELPRHQLLGWPTPVQYTPLYGCDFNYADQKLNYRLLLQLDFDVPLRFAVGDGGVLYLTGKPADLRAGRFDRLCAEMQQG